MSLTRSRKIRGILAKMANILCLLLFCWIFIILGLRMTETTPVVYALLPATLLLLWYLSKKHLVLKWEYSYEVIWWALFAISAFFVYYLAYELRVAQTWDWGVLLQCSYLRVDGDMETGVKYFARYPNNQLWFAFLVCFLRLIKVFAPNITLEAYQDVTVALSATMVIVAMLFMRATAKVLWGSKKSLIVAVIIITCMPLYLYATFAYTDTAGVLASSIAVYCFVKAEHATGKMQLICAAILGVFAAVALHLKVTLFILFIAMIVAFFLRVRSVRKVLLGALLSMILLVVTFCSIDYGVSKVIQIPEATYERYEFPLTHWIMMALNNGGAYMQEDVDYTKQFKTYDEKKEANLDMIEERLEERGVLGTISYILYDKFSFAWGDPALGADNYVSRQPQKPDGFWQQFFTLTGTYYGIAKAYFYLYQMLLLLGVILSIVAALRRKVEDQPLLFGRILLVGVVLFFAVWECNSRYLVTFLPILIILSAEGYMYFRNRSHRKECV